MTGKALVFEKEQNLLDNLLTSLFAVFLISMLMVFHVPLLQNGGCILNTQPVAANDYCRINGLF
jgi:hypothetical protein